MSDLVNCAFTVVSHVADCKNVTLQLNYINESEKPYYNGLYGDKSRFLQVLINLLNNALKFSNRDSRVVVFLKMLEY
jgi:signal transduction histidine kinase